MYVYTYMFICMYIGNVFLHTYTCGFAYVYAIMHVSVDLYIHLSVNPMHCARAWTCTWVKVCKHVLAHLDMRTCSCRCTRTCICRCVTSTYMLMYMRINVYAEVYVHAKSVRIYICICICICICELDMCIFCSICICENANM